MSKLYLGLVFMLLAFQTACGKAKRDGPPRSPKPTPAVIRTAEVVEKSIPGGCVRRFNTHYKLRAFAGGSLAEFSDRVSSLDARQIAQERVKAVALYSEAATRFDDPDASSGARQEAYCDKRISLAYEATLAFSQHGLVPDLRKYQHNHITRSGLQKCAEAVLRPLISARLSGLKYEVVNSDDSNGGLRTVPTHERSPRDDLRDGAVVVYAVTSKEVQLEILFYLKRAYRGYDFEGVEDEDDEDVRALRRELDGMLGGLIEDMKARCK